MRLGVWGKNAEPGKVLRRRTQHQRQQQHHTHAQLRIFHTPCTTANGDDQANQGPTSSFPGFGRQVARDWCRASRTLPASRARDWTGRWPGATPRGTLSTPLCLQSPLLLQLAARPVCAAAVFWSRMGFVGSRVSSAGLVQWNGPGLGSQWRRWSGEERTQLRLFLGGKGFGFARKVSF